MPPEFREQPMTVRWVDILHQPADSDGPVLLARCILEAGSLRIEGDSPTAKALRENGVESFGDDRMIKPIEGEKFLRALGDRFRSAPYIYATKIQEDVTVAPSTAPAWQEVPSELPQNPQAGQEK